MRYVKDVASVIRSKNAGPYELTFDLMFPDEETYEQVKHSITKEKIAALYKIRGKPSAVHRPFSAPPMP